MIPHIPNQRKFKSNSSKPFNDLIAYIEGEQEQTKTGQGTETVSRRQQITSKFNDLVDYAINQIDGTTKTDKCIAIRTHGISAIQNASAEMNAVAAKNTRCKDPTYHVILSWPEHEKPDSGVIFDAAEHALEALGLAEHQYVLAIHGNTDNVHCHISVNRVHPITFKARHIEWAEKELHHAARESEIKHGWSHDNGIYIVEVDGHNKKQIVLNPDHAGALANATPHAHRDLGDEKLLPTWHDPESLESWLKTKVAKALKHVLPDLESWHALHSWLSTHAVTLTDSGGGGLRLRATSPDTGEILDIAASKGLRAIKRADLERRWGAFTKSPEIACKVPDLSHLTPSQITQGVNDVLTNTLDAGRPPEHVLRAQQSAIRDATDRSSGLHELPAGGLDAGRQDRSVSLPDPALGRLGDPQTGQDSDLRRPGTSQASGASQRSLNRDNSKRAERKDQRALARADLRARFAHYIRLVRAGDTGYFRRAKALQLDRRQKLKEIREKRRAAQRAIPAATPLTTRLIINIEIDAESLRRKLEAEAQFQTDALALRVARVPPLSWRVWLHEQSNLGDQAALSALRGIVYQAQRDAKRHKGAQSNETLVLIKAAAGADPDLQYHQAMERLLDQERRETAIRSASSLVMRPYQADALLVKYSGIQWHVTGNGNVQYSDKDANHLFTDRGSRVTFDRIRVADDDIRLALAHAQHKFGQQLTLTGDDAAFTRRMAILADDMDITILNPGLQAVIAQHRATRVQQLAQALTITPASAQVNTAAPRDVIGAPERITATAKPAASSQGNDLADQPSRKEVEPAAAPAQAALDRLRDIVRSIDPHATFVTADSSSGVQHYIGLVAAASDGPEACFAQSIGRGVYALHAFDAPEHDDDAVIEILYRNGQVDVKTIATGQAKDLGL